LANSPFSPVKSEITGYRDAAHFRQDAACFTVSRAREDQRAGWSNWGNGAMLRRFASPSRQPSGLLSLDELQRHLRQ